MQKTQLAMFPLQIFLLPGETTRLHIFEERYRQLLDDCENIHISFGIPFTQNGYLTGFGCIVELKQVIRRHASGASDIEIEATGLFRMDRFYMRMGSKLYPGGEVHTIDTQTWPGLSMSTLVELEKYLRELSGASIPELFSSGLNIVDAALALHLGDEEKLKIVKAGSFEKKERILLENIKLQKLMAAQKNSIRGELFLN
jgi:hypothetical protein